MADERTCVTAAAAAGDLVAHAQLEEGGAVALAHAEVRAGEDGVAGGVAGAAPAVDVDGAEEHEAECEGPYERGEDDAAEFEAADRVEDRVAGSREGVEE